MTNIVVLVYSHPWKSCCCSTLSLINFTMYTVRFRIYNRQTSNDYKLRMYTFLPVKLNCWHHETVGMWYPLSSRRHKICWKLWNQDSLFFCWWLLRLYSSRSYCWVYIFNSSCDRAFAVFVFDTRSPLPLPLPLPLKSHLLPEIRHTSLILGTVTTPPLSSLLAFNLIQQHWIISS